MLPLAFCANVANEAKDAIRTINNVFILIFLFVNHQK
jgi:hypothetical protein